MVWARHNGNSNSLNPKFLPDTWHLFSFKNFETIGCHNMEHVPPFYSNKEASASSFWPLSSLQSLYFRVSWIGYGCLWRIFSKGVWGTKKIFQVYYIRWCPFFNTTFSTLVNTSNVGQNVSVDLDRNPTRVGLLSRKELWGSEAQYVLITRQKKPLEGLQQSGSNIMNHERGFWLVPFVVFSDFLYTISFILKEIWIRRHWMEFTELSWRSYCTLLKIPFAKQYLGPIQAITLEKTEPGSFQLRTACLKLPQAPKLLHLSTKVSLV